MAAPASTMADAPLLDARKAGLAINLIDAVLAAKKAGKGYLAQVLEMRRLARAPGRLRPQEYYAFRLYGAGLEAEAKRAFVGERGQLDLYRRLCDTTWFAPAHDKLLYYTILEGLGLAAPRVHGVYHAFRTHPGAEALRSAGDVAAFLRRSSAYPLFGKPVAGKYSVGTVLLAGYDAATDRLLASDGRGAKVDAFVAELGAHARGGYLFQERLTPHPALNVLVGDRIATVRVVVLLGRDGPQVFRALWKLPTGAHVADNFWRAGNMLAALDAGSGTITRVVQGVGHRQVEVASHPDTGQALVGATVPDWDRARELCLTASRAFPGLRMQAWDVAPCADGPLLLELNVGGDVNLPQHAFGAGIYDGALRRMIETPAA